MAYTASAPVKVLVKNVMSSTEPMAANAPSLVSSVRFWAVRPITVTVCPAFNNCKANGFEMCPALPVITYFMLLCVFICIYKC